MPDEPCADSEPHGTEPEPARSPTGRNVGQRGLRILLLWLGMLLLFVTLWNWVGPGSLK